MNREEAARYLGVSLRTRDRIAATGRLTKGRALKKTRPIVVYKQQELDSVKEDIHRNQQQITADLAYKPLPLGTVAFRFEPVYLRMLSDRAKQLGRSPGEYARHVVIQSLERDPSTGVFDEIKKLREGLGATFYALLTLKMGVSPEDARRFVDQSILK